MRSAESLSATAPRASDMPGAIAPPRTTMPSGGPCAGFHGGKRSSSGRMSIRPSGEYPTKAMSTRLDTISQLASRRNRVSSNARPTSPTAINKFDGTPKKPSVLERMKNITFSSHPTPPRQAESSLARLAPGRITRFGLVVRRIEAGQLDALLDLGEDPALVKFVLGAFVRHKLNQGLGNNHGTVVVEHDHVAREDRTTAAGDRLFPSDEGQAVDRS